MLTRRSSLVGLALIPLLHGLGACGRGEPAAEAPAADPSPPPIDDPPVADPTPSSDDAAALLERAATALAAANGGCSVILSDPAFMPIHSSPEFRKLVADNAKPRPLVIVTPEEPGTAMIMRGTMLDAKRKPRADTLVLVYHTDDAGYYTTPTSDSPPSGDPHHARLFGYVRTGSDGRFELRTIKPASYANTTVPRHMHIEIWRDGAAVAETEMMFSDDENFAGEARDRAQREGYLAKPSTDADGTTVYTAEFVVAD